MSTFNPLLKDALGLTGVCLGTGVCARTRCACVCVCVRACACARTRCACVCVCVRACACARTRCACVCVCVCENEVWVGVGACSFSSPQFLLCSPAYFCLQKWFLLLFLVALPPSSQCSARRRRGSDPRGEATTGGRGFLRQRCHTSTFFLFSLLRFGPELLWVTSPGATGPAPPGMDPGP